jgi:hypothetical protein
LSSPFVNKGGSVCNENVCNRRDLRLAWRQLHRTDPPPGLSRDLLIRALAHHLQEQSYGGAASFSSASATL